MSFKTIKSIGAIVLSMMVLCACGDGWVAEKTTSYFPYGNERTAGSGIVYVRAKLLPERQLNLLDILDIKAEPEASERIMGAEDLFKKLQRK